jgi:lysosomal acid lipase/cholesteryl ester hydrolase
MTTVFLILLGAIAIAPTIYFFSFNNLALTNYKEFIERFGHNLEENEVTTEDGYILNLWHLIPNFSVNPEKVIFLQPGFASTGICYFSIKKKSLAYLLQEKGYDVWIGNNRGSKFSSKHVSKNPKDVNGDFWEFSLDDFAKYDITAEINYIKKRTGAKKVHFVGYSEGSTLLLMLYMDNPQFVESSINKFISIATVPNLLSIPVSISESIDKICDYLEIAEPFTKAFQISDSIRTTLVKSVKSNPKYFVKKFKEDGSITNKTDSEAIAFFLSHYPTDTSIYHLYQWEKIQEEKKLVHYNVHSKEKDKFREYDLNVLKNWKIKTFVTRSKCDNFSPYNEVTEFYNNIKNKSLITFFDSDYAHLDYGLAKSAYKDIYIPIVNYLDEK